jgi:methylated-DNA-[protein]-cysteine S-methyltransferase
MSYSKGLEQGFIMNNTEYTIKSTVLGNVLLIARNNLLVGVYFENQKNSPEIQKDWVRKDYSVFFDSVAKQVHEYLDGKQQGFSCVYQFDSGTALQRATWKALQNISYGVTVSYAEIARTIGAPSSVRAVASAIGKNPLAVIVPCHRVIGTDGSLRGYAGGLHRKQALLVLEKNNVHKLLNQERCHDVGS